MATVTTVPKLELEADRALVNAALAQALGGDGTAAGGAVSDAMRYAVLGAGQRIRPILALRLARLLEAPQRLTTRAAVSVEFFHAASLIIDDLPCMDDDEMRRNRPAVHRAFGEATAILAAFGLVALAARSLNVDDGSRAEREALLGFQRRLLGALDCSGLIAGQALDLGIPEGPGRFDLVSIAEFKTVPLFDLAARAGILFADLPRSERDELIRFGRDFGTAFQLVDDYLDGDLQDPGLAMARLEAARMRLAPYGDRAQEVLDLVNYLDARLTQHPRSRNAA